MNDSEYNKKYKEIKEDKKESRKKDYEESKRCEKVKENKKKKKKKFEDEDEKGNSDSDDENDGGNFQEKKLKKISFEKKESSDEEEAEKEIIKVSKLNQEKSSLPPKEEKFNYNFKDMILTQNIIEGNWSLNSQTKHLISLNLILYEKIKNYVEKYYQKEDKEDVIITILVIYCLKNNKDIELSEYMLIINKGIEYLESKGIENISYKNIEP